MSNTPDKVVLITGAARGQGRSHALAFAREGARIIAIDACADIEGVPYPMANEDDLKETVRLVEAAGGKITAKIADVRSQESLDAAIIAGIEELGVPDTVIANAGVLVMGPMSWEATEAQWTNTVDIILNGAWRTCKAVVPYMIEAGKGGSIILVSSSNGFRGEPNHSSYNASKYGLIAFMRALANELGPHWIRVNTIHPCTVRTDMTWNESVIELFAPGHDMTTITEDEWYDNMAPMNVLPVGAIQPSDVSEVVKFLASDGAKFITASEIPVDAGYIRKV